MAMKVEHWIRRIGSVKRVGGVQFRVNPVLGIFLREEREENIRELSARYRLEIVIVDDPRLHREAFEIFTLDGRRDLKAELG